MSPLQLDKLAAIRAADALRPYQSSVRVKVLVGQIITRLVGGELDYEKVGKLASGTVSDSDVRAAVAALHFVLVSSGARGRAGVGVPLSVRRASAAKHSVEEAQLAKELLQLGLPKGAFFGADRAQRALTRTQSTRRP